MNRFAATKLFVVGLCLGLNGCGDSPSAPIAKPADSATQSAPVAQAGPSSGPQLITSPNDFSWIDRRADRPFNVEEFLTQRKAGPEEERRAEIYRQGLSLISQDLGGQSVKELSNRISAFADREKLLTGEFSDASIAQLITDTRPAVALMDQAQKISISSERAVFMFGFRFDALLPESQAARQVARLATIECYYASKTGQIEPAHQAVERALQLSRDLQPRGAAISQLVSTSIDGSVADSVTNLLLNHPKLTKEDCDRLLAALHRHHEHPFPKYAEALKGDYLTTMATLAAIQSGEVDATTAISLSGPSALPRGMKIEHLDLESEYVATSKLMKIALEESILSYSKLPAKTRFSEELNNVIKAIELGMQQSNRRVPLATALMIPAVETTRDALVRSETSLNALKCLLALRRYELTHGTLPPTLDVATKEAGIQQISSDVYSGTPLKFILKNGKALIYSVGKDRHDDGGLTDWEWGQKPGDFLFSLPPLPPGTQHPKTESPRTWTSTVGTKIEAAYVSSDEKEVVLRKTEDKEIRVPLEKLSQSDRDWIGSIKKSVNR